MSYETLNSTRLLATNCACCGRPLRDAVSARCGIGPDCRSKYGYDAGPETHREEANALIYTIADSNAPEADIVGALQQLAAIGYGSLAKNLAAGITPVKLEREGETLVLRSPYNPVAVDVLRRVPGRRWDAANKVNTFPATSRNQLWAALKTSFPGSTMLLPDGNITKIPARA